MKPRVLILTDPYTKPAYVPRLRFLCDWMTEQGWIIQVHTELFQDYAFAHTYPIYEYPVYQGEIDWAIKAMWSLLTDWRNRHFSQQVRKAVEKEHFDLVLCTTFSTFPLRAAWEVAQEKGIPWIADVRDIDEQVPGAQYQSHRQWWARPFRNWYKRVNIRRRNKALAHADAITTISPWHVEFLKTVNPNTHLIYNGYAPKQFYPENVISPQFMITYIGRLYEFQSLDLIQRIVEEMNMPDLKLNLHLPNSRCIPITAVGDEIRQSSIMLVLTNSKAKGMMTTKFYEALGCEKPILCIPSDEGVLAQAMRDTNAGLVSSNPDEIKEFILDKYHEWQEKGFTRQAVKNKDRFSRENQARQFADLMAQVIQQHG